MTTTRSTMLAVLTFAVCLFNGPSAAAQTKSYSDSLFKYLSGCNGDPKVVMKYVEEGADVNFKDAQYQITPLMEAISCKQLEAARVLLDHGADVNARNVEGNTPLYIAAHDSLPEFFNVLVEKGAKINVGNKFGYTPLRAACKLGDANAAAYFVSKGADVNIKDRKGDTPLHVASDQGSVDVARLLRISMPRGRSAIRPFTLRLRGRMWRS
jgi:ankyrin repeat protein